MDLTSILAQLRKQRDLIDTVISDLEQLEHEGRRGLSRPRNLVAQGDSNGANDGSRPPDLPGDED